MAKILIVEDDPLSALDLQNEVQRLGYEVVGMAESADEALIASEESRPDLALLDINIAGRWTEFRQRVCCITLIEFQSYSSLR